MSGNKIKIDDKQIKCILQDEFLEKINEWNTNTAERAREALCAYESVGDFLEDTGWGRDNPECCREEYLTKNRICCWINNVFWYFSRIIWEDTSERQF